jgi:hypothetical protein
MLKGLGLNYVRWANIKKINQIPIGIEILHPKGIKEWITPK